MLNNVILTVFYEFNVSLNFTKTQLIQTLVYLRCFHSVLRASFMAIGWNILTAALHDVLARLDSRSFRIRLDVIGIKSLPTFRKWRFLNDGCPWYFHVCIVFVLMLIVYLLPTRQVLYVPLVFILGVWDHPCHINIEQSVYAGTLVLAHAGFLGSSLGV